MLNFMINYKKKKTKKKKIADLWNCMDKHHASKTYSLNLCFDGGCGEDCQGSF